MIVSKTPLRISFVGGGSDLPSFYEKVPGGVISTTIDKYVYIVVHPSFNENNRIQYSIFEETKNVEEIKNTRIRECMKMTGVVKGVEIHSLSEVPTRTGLGGSSSFTIGLLNALYAYKGKLVSAERLAKEACEIEIDVLKEPIGKQDQYIAAYGGLNHIQFFQDGDVFVNPLLLNPGFKKQLVNNLLLFYTGITRSASEILSEQSFNMGQNEIFEKMKRMVTLTEELKKNLNENSVINFGEMLNENWRFKKMMAGRISNAVLDEYYSRSLNLGATGGKILGAGGGGFLLLYCEPEKQEGVRKGLADLKELHFNFASEGSKIIYASE